MNGKPGPDRLTCKPRSLDSMRSSIFGWAGIDQEKQSWAWAVWQWFMQQAKEHQKNLEEMPINMGGVRLTCQYLMMVLEDIPVDDRLLRQHTNTEKDEWLLWRGSTMAEFARTCARQVNQDRLEQKVPEIRNSLQKTAKTGGQGSLKASEMLLKMAGRANGEPQNEGGIKVTVVDRYVKGPGGVLPVMANVNVDKHASVPTTELETRVLQPAQKQTQEEEDGGNESGQVRSSAGHPSGRAEALEGYGSEQDSA